MDILKLYTNVEVIGVSAKILNRAKSLFKRLNKKEKEILLKHIQELVGIDTDSDNLLSSIRKGQFKNGNKCPHCKSSNIIKHGKFKYRQRYKCKDCGRTFCDTTLTPFSYSKKKLSVCMNMLNVCLKVTLYEKVLKSLK